MLHQQVSDHVGNEIVNVKANMMINQEIDLYKDKLNKIEIDRIREDCK